MKSNWLNGLFLDKNQPLLGWKQGKLTHQYHYDNEWKFTQQVGKKDVGGAF